MDIEVVFFDPRYFIFNLGLALNRYEQHNVEYKWVKKELDLGLFFMSIRFSIKRDMQRRGEI
jgi:hypothetical protein